MNLLGKYEKFPEYLQIKVERNPHFFDLQPVFKPFSKFTINQMFSVKERNVLIDSCFPFTLRCFLLPELNVLTTQLISDLFTAD